MTFKLWWILSVSWALLALATALNEATSDVSAVSGSTSYAIDAINLAFASDTVGLDTPTFQGTTSNPVDTDFGLPKNGAAWISLVWSALTLQSSIWEGWASTIAFILRVIYGVFAIVIFREGLFLLSSVFGGPFGRSSPG